MIKKKRCAKYILLKEAHKCFRNIFNKNNKQKKKLKGLLLILDICNDLFLKTVAS